MSELGGFVLIAAILISAWMLLGGTRKLVSGGVGDWLTQHVGESAPDVVAMFGGFGVFGLLLAATAAAGVGVPFLLIGGFVALVKGFVDLVEGNEVSDG